ncbi:GntR family transcriptional regulator [Brucella gallinifaecis]|uniref:GntR family transcriptional regulator n=1 Tax=Brucella gallinifaecis TaxID=215590 RepID=UPI00235E117E|nr:GntR family transcriptional regulator [Brucella gallinifaecis]
MSKDEAAMSTAARVRDAIEQDILTRVLAPGQRVDEQSISKRFGVSRTPVREALAQLAADGQLELKPNRGAFVSNLGIERVIQMFEVMAELEAMAGRLAAARFTSEDSSSLQQALAECVRAASEGDTDAYYYENERFHQAIYSASYNGFLIEQCEALQRRLRPYRRLQLRAVNRMRTSLAEHQSIVTAILDGDGEKAGKHLRDHIIIQGERFQDLVALMSKSQSSV